MALESNVTVFIGNLVADPELRFTGSGTAVCNVRVANNRKKPSGEEEATFMSVTCWQGLAENVAEELHKGDRVVVVGRLQQRQFEKRDGSKGESIEIVADEVSRSLRFRPDSPKPSSSGSSSVVDDGEVPF